MNKGVGVDGSVSKMHAMQQEDLACWHAGIFVTAVLGEQRQVDHSLTERGTLSQKHSRKLTEGDPTFTSQAHMCLHMCCAHTHMGRENKKIKE